MNKIKQKIISKHQGDSKQLEAIFSPSDRILIEAPAGYGKTNLMVSKIAYMLVTKQIPNPKKLLALTFSVNAAYKIKKDIEQQIPELLKETGVNINIRDKVFVSNYHGLCRNVIKKYGYKFHPSLFDIDKLQSIDDSNEKHLIHLISDLSYVKLMLSYNNAVKKNNEKFLLDNLDCYNMVVINELLPKQVITYNAILTLTIKLFDNYPKILDFYQKYFTIIFVDEYQDTNRLSYFLLQKLITNKTKVIFCGDSLQRIYGFIGAIPNLLLESEKTFNLTRIQLSKNYRFASNKQMLQLDLNIRRNAENPYTPKIEDNCIIDVSNYHDQETEAINIVDNAVFLTQNNPTSKVSILVKQRGPNINYIINTFKNKNIPYFYGLFTDEDIAYVQFHRQCLFIFIELIKVKEQITKKIGREHIKKIIEFYDTKTDSLIESLINLLNIFWKKVFSDFSFLSNEEKIFLLKDTFEHNSLKQYIEFIDTRIIISTVHAAKGLEWDFVILPDMEQDLFPNWSGLCINCNCKKDCNLVITTDNEQKFLDELSVFYVAVTRAKKKVYFTTSKTQIDNYNNKRVKNISCFLKIPGIVVNKGL